MLCRYVNILRCIISAKGLTSPGPMATVFGRKSSLYIACLLVYVANIVMMTTVSIGGLYAGRLVLGLGNGFLMTFSQLYIQVNS